MKPGTGVSLCEGRLEKQRFKQEPRRAERKAEEGPFGSSTPSARIPLKANTAEQQRAKPGGAKAGHPGHGHKTFAEAEAGADRIEEALAGES